MLPTPKKAQISAVFARMCKKMLQRFGKIEENAYLCGVFI